MNRVTASVLLSVGVLAAGAAWLSAGPLDPPPGPVAPTSPSLADLSSQLALIGSSTSGGSVIPGNSFAGTGTLDITINGVLTSVPAYSVQQKLSGGAALNPDPRFAPLVPSTLVVVTDASGAIVPLVNKIRLATKVQACTLTFPRGSGTWTITGTGETYLRAVTFSALPKSDGTTAHVAVLELVGFDAQSNTGVLLGRAWTYSLDGAGFTTLEKTAP